MTNYGAIEKGIASSSSRDDHDDETYNTSRPARYEQQTGSSIVSRGIRALPLLLLIIVGALGVTMYSGYPKSSLANFSALFSRTSDGAETFIDATGSSASSGTADNLIVPASSTSGTVSSDAASTTNPFLSNLPGSDSSTSMSDSSAVNPNIPTVSTPTAVPTMRPSGPSSEPTLEPTTVYQLSKWQRSPTPKPTPATPTLEPTNVPSVTTSTGMTSSHGDKPTKMPKPTNSPTPGANSVTFGSMPTTPTLAPSKRSEYRNSLTPKPTTDKTTTQLLPLTLPGGDSNGDPSQVVPSGDNLATMSHTY